MYSAYEHNRAQLKALVADTKALGETVNGQKCVVPRELDQSV